MLIFFLDSNLPVIICRLLHSYSTTWQAQIALQVRDIMSSKTTLILSDCRVC